MKLLCDIETDGFEDTLTRLWTIQLGTEDGDDSVVYADQPGFPPLSEAVARIAEADLIIMHNGMRFDGPVLNRFYPGLVDPYKVFDTMVAARLLFRDAQDHKLDTWGKRLGILKGTYSGDFSRFDDHLVEYARQDIPVTRALWHKIRAEMQEWDWSRCLWIENLFQYVIGLQEKNGFLLDVDAARVLEVELRGQLDGLRERLQEVFPPRWVPKDGTAEKSYRENKRKPDKKSPAVPMPYTAISLEQFNPGSRQQGVSRLQDKYGFTPWKFTDGGSPALDEEVLGELEYPEAKLLLEYLHTEKMLSQIVSKKGDKGWLIYVNDETHRVHGAVNTAGTDTGRCSHFRPNMAQVNKDPRMRACWLPRVGWILVGVDADGLEFVCLAHYLDRIDGGAAVKFHLEGDKKKGTDVHSRNRDGVLKAIWPRLKVAAEFLGKLRDNAKTLLYAMIYGGRNPRLGVSVLAMATVLDKTLTTDPAVLGLKARKAIAKNLPGLDTLIERVTKKAKAQGYIKGIDGRKIFIRSPHSAFNFMLQGAGAIVMKLALVIFYFERMAVLGYEHGVDYAFVANVHDEVQMECRPDIADTIGQEMISSITEAAERLGFRCPLTGEAKIGSNWAETH